MDRLTTLLNRNLAFAAVVVAMLPAVLDQTMLSTALPVIAGDLGALGDIPFVVTAYVVAAAAVTPLWGKLGDRHGRKPMLEAALVLFVTASALCGVAQDITQLIVGALAEAASWRWIFFVNLPVGALAFTGLHLRLPAVPVERPAHALDVP